MSVAVSTVATVLALLPGVGYIAGLYSKDRYPRQLNQRSTIAEIAQALFVAAMLHFLVASAAYFFIGTKDITNFLSHLNTRISVEEAKPQASSPAEGQPAADPSIENEEQTDTESEQYTLSQNRVSAFFAITLVPLSYVLSLTIIAYIFGRFHAFLIVKQILGLHEIHARHQWIHDIIAKHHKNEVTTKIYIMTKIQIESRILMYKGYLQDVYFNADGTLSHIVLSSCFRYYMIADEDGPWTTFSGGLSFPIAGDDKFKTSGSDEDNWPTLIFEGADLHNFAVEQLSTVEGRDSSFKTLAKEAREADAIIDRMVEEINIEEPNTSEENKGTPN